MTSTTLAPNNTRQRVILLAWALWAGLPLGLALSRLLYELNPVQFNILGSVNGAALTGVAVMLIWWVFLQRLIRMRPDDPLLPMYASIPLLLAFVVVLYPPFDVNPLRNLLLTLGGLSISITLTLSRLSQTQETTTSKYSGAILVAAVLLIVYLLTLQRTIGRADTFEFQVTAPVLGIAHPTGYPLYVLLGKFFSWLPLGKMATRVNLTSVTAAVSAATGIFVMLKHVLKIDNIIAALATFTFGLSPVFWSQAVVAEVYPLHNAFAVAIIGISLWLIVQREPTLTPWKNTPSQTDHSRLVLILLLLIGLSLTNHLTTVLLLPAVVISLYLAWPRLSWKQWLTGVGLLLAALLIYLYIPIRWPAVTGGEAMPFNEFVGWITGSRFSGALQLRAWLTDADRWRIVGRLVYEQVGLIGIILAATGLLALAWQRWRIALITVLVFAAQGFYGLNYLVPDINVFLIPMYWITVLWLAYGVQFILIQLEHTRWRAVAKPAGLALLALLPLSLGWQGVEQFDWRDEAQLETWGRYVLDLPLVEDSAILADSEKIAPLEYLHRIENLRPDMEMIVLGTEAEYYEQLYARISAGQTIYLARFLPGLEGAFHLRSVGPLIEVATEPLATMPEIEPASHSWQNDIVLAGYMLDVPAIHAGQDNHLTLVWQAPDTVLTTNYQVHLRLLDANNEIAWQATPQYTVNNRYPTVAWKPSEIITDYHPLALPASLSPGTYTVQVALAPPFSTDYLSLVDESNWAEIATFDIAAPLTVPPPLTQRVAIVASDTAITSIELPEQLLLGGQTTFNANWRQSQRQFQTETTFVAADTELEIAGTGLILETVREAETAFIWQLQGEDLRCGWFQPETNRCQLAASLVMGETVADAVANFDNQIMLLSVDFPAGALTPGSTLPVALEWQALRSISEDYTVFVHLIGPDGLLHGQIDTWPVQGTYPTSTWTAGERIVDRYEVPLDLGAPAGNYQLAVGMYLLGTNARLQTIGQDGIAFNDKMLFEGIFVPN